MANVLYPKAKEGFLGGDIDMEVDNIVSILVDTASYTYNPSHVFLSEIPAVERVATSNNLSSKSILNGVFDSDDILYLSVTGDISEALVLVQDSGGGASFGTPTLTKVRLLINPATIPTEVIVGSPLVTGGGHIIVPLLSRRTFNTVAQYLRDLIFKGQDNEVILAWLRSEGIDTGIYI